MVCELLKRLQWFVRNRPDLCGNLASMTERGVGERRMLSLVGPRRLRRILEKVLDESEFLAPHGVRALSRYHAEHPFVMDVDGHRHEVRYEPAESSTGLFGGNSNWRGPIWFPVNYLLVESLQRFDVNTRGNPNITPEQVRSQGGGVFPDGDPGRRPALGARALGTARRQHHHPHDALGIDAPAVALDPDVAAVLAGHLRQLGRGARMQAQLVDDFSFLLLHCAF